MFLMLEDGGGKLVSVHMYIKAWRVTEQPLTAGTLTVNACKQEKGYRIFLRTRPLPHIAAQHGIQQVLCLVPATAATVLSYITILLLPCFPPLLLLKASIFWACAKSKDRREGGKLTPLFGRLCSQGQSQIQTFWKAVHIEQVNISESLRKSLYLKCSLLQRLWIPYSGSNLHFIFQFHYFNDCVWSLNFIISKT